MFFQLYGLLVKSRRFFYNVRFLQVKQPLGKRKYSFWKLLLLALITSALAGIILAILIPTVNP